MTIIDVTRALRRSWAAIAILVVAGVGVGALWTSVSTPRFTAATELFISVRPGAPDVADIAQGNTAAQQKVTSYVAVVTSASVLEPVIRELGLDEDVAELAGRIEAKSPANSVLIDISVSDTDAPRARDIANAVGRSFIEVITDRLEKPTAGGNSLVRPETIEPAVTPEDPTSPDLAVNVLLGVVLGLSAGFLVAVLRHTLDTKVRTIEDLTQVTDATLLGNVAFDPKTAERPLVVQTEPLSPDAESFRTLRTNVQFTGLANAARTIVITSSSPSEGKSTIAANLAIAMAETGARVALVDADLRRPRVAELMRVEGSVGLTDVLIGRAELEDVMLPWGHGDLQVLPAGQIPPNPSELLGSFTMQKLVEVFAAEFDAVIFDAPPLLPVTDAAVLSRLAGSAILVSAVGQTTQKQLRAAIDAVASAGASTLGIVRTKVPRRGKASDVYGGYYLQGEPPADMDAVPRPPGRRAA